jgi:hypothetical protein
LIIFCLIGIIENIPFTSTIDPFTSTIDPLLLNNDLKDLIEVAPSL